MKITENEVVTRTRLASVICNKCGKEMITPESPEGNGAFVHYNAGYDSEHFIDGEHIHFDICEECISELVRGFKHPPCRSSYLED